MQPWTYQRALDPNPSSPLQSPEYETETTPISPPSGPTQWLFQGPPAESKVLAVIVRSRLELEAPVTAKVTLKTTTADQAAFAWRTNDQKDFLLGNRALFAVTSSDDWQTFETPLPASMHVHRHA